LSESTEHRNCRIEHLISAFRAAVLDVPVIDRESDIGVIHAGGERRYLGLVLGLGVRHIAPEPEREGRLGAEGGSSGGRAQHNCDQKQLSPGKSSNWSRNHGSFLS